MVDTRLEERLALVKKRLQTLENTPVLFATSRRHPKSGRWNTSYWTVKKVDELEVPLNCEPHENIYTVDVETLIINVGNDYPQVRNCSVKCLVIKYCLHPDLPLPPICLLEDLLRGLPSCNLVVIEGLNNPLVEFFISPPAHQFVLRYNPTLTQQEKSRLSENWASASTTLRNVSIEDN